MFRHLRRLLWKMIKRALKVNVLLHIDTCTPTCTHVHAHVYTHVPSYPHNHIRTVLTLHHIVYSVSSPPPPKKKQTHTHQITHVQSFLLPPHTSTCVVTSFLLSTGFVKYLHLTSISTFTFTFTELFTLLRRSQNSRLDDQRGLLNKELELPDFLKLPRKTSIRSSFLNVGVPSPRAHHAPLKKTTSSPPSCTPCTKVTVQTQSSTMTKRTQGTGFFRNLSGSSLSRGRTKVDGAYQTTNQTQTIDRKHFMNKSASGSRMRSGSLQYNNSDVHLDVLGGTELRGQTSSHYRSELSFEKNETQVVWVTTNTTNKNRRRGGGGGGGEGGGGEGGGGGIEHMTPGKKARTRRMEVRSRRKLRLLFQM